MNHIPQPGMIPQHNPSVILSPNGGPVVRTPNFPPLPLSVGHYQGGPHAAMSFYPMMSANMVMNPQFHVQPQLHPHPAQAVHFIPSIPPTQAESVSLQTSASATFVPREKQARVFKDPQTKKDIDLSDIPTKLSASGISVSIISAPPSISSSADTQVPAIKDEIKVDSTSVVPVPEAELHVAVEAVPAPVDEKLIVDIHESIPLAIIASEISEKPEDAVADNIFDGSDDEEEFVQVEETPVAYLADSTDSKKQATGPYSISFLLHLKPARCPKPLQLPSIRDVTDDVDDVSGEYDRALKHTKHGSNLYEPIQSAARRGDLTRRPMQNYKPSTGTYNAQPPKTVVRWKPGINTSFIQVDVAKKIKGILNRLNTKNFDILSKELLELINQNVSSIDQLNEVVNLIFETALAQPAFCSVYADACVLLNSNFKHLLVTQVSDSGESTEIRVGIKKVLLGKCQSEFDTMGQATRALAANSTLSAEEKEALRVKTKSIALGNIKFFGELFKRQIVSENIIHGRALVYLLKLDLASPEHEEELEALCKLFMNCGPYLDNEKQKDRIVLYFGVLNTIRQTPTISNRMKFMIEDVIDFRMNNWVHRVSGSASSANVKPVASVHLAQQPVPKFSIMNRPIPSSNPPSSKPSTISSISNLAVAPSTQSHKIPYKNTPKLDPPPLLSADLKNAPKIVGISTHEAIVSSKNVPLCSPNSANTSEIVSGTHDKYGEDFMDQNLDFLESIGSAVQAYGATRVFDDLVAAVNKFDSPLRLILFVAKCILLCAEGLDQNINLTTEILCLSCKSLIDTKNLVEGISCAFSVMTNTYMDSPHLATFLPTLFCALIVDKLLSVQSILSLFPIMKDAKLIQDVLGHFLKRLVDLVCYFFFSSFM